MTESSPVSPTSTFVLRFWREWSITMPRWRGRIEHVQSGQYTDFVELEDLLEFVRAFGALPEDQMTPRKADQ